MARRSSRDLDDEQDDTPIDRLVTALEHAPNGLHDLAEPTGDVPLAWPASMSDVYLAFDGATLFHEELTIYPAADVATGDDGLYVVGTVGESEVKVDGRGRVIAVDTETGENIVEGTTLARWLRGWIDALLLTIDKDGEYKDDVFDAQGEVVREVAIAQARAQVKRDTRAPGPRWRLARLYAASSDPAQLALARKELETVVEIEPSLPWAWLDLARISEQLGELEGAYDEAVAAAEAAPDHDQVAYFWAHAARIALRRGAEADRATAAARATAADPRLVEAQLAGAEQNLTDKDFSSARALVALARAVQPKNLNAIDLSRRIEAADPVN
ncbi:MAG TPA: hypothetical protein VL463_14265 [Kofleriaceae bacterium]|nr:hypothetical protein [Kofleriaceae bacterium]